MDHEFRDPLPLARVVRIALGVWLIAMTVYAVMSGYTIVTVGAFQAGTAGQEDLERLDAISQAISIPVIAVNLIAIVLVARWIWRVNKNAHALSDSMEMTPGWNVGFFFIPILNLWKPFQGILQTWRASFSPYNAEDADVPAWVPVWWVSWIISNILSNIAFRLGMRAETLDDYVAVSWIELWCLPFDLISGITLFLLVTRLSRVQHNVRDVEAHEAVFE
ncbi:DUF4328 domain-containing protein [Sphingomonas sp. AOB5]|uniref:DUF4328 domain-containing protein n=1 Tax=Sphingomonas sp. AOB5 TaxID=3034017 RepID=UPI0023F9E224|nr:DUF4328 domain-containing protein [Sphingomonas sp. AOB5]MDF7777438.1 DUF4328 domain-containing protein [Sphingomonas sp. AOB5]